MGSHCPELLRLDPVSETIEMDKLDASFAFTDLQHRVLLVEVVDPTYSANGLGHRSNADVVQGLELRNGVH